MRTILTLLVGLVFCPTAFSSDSLETRWVRDSVEYWTLTRQTYRTALEQVTARAAKQKKWAVVLDVDETVLDNSAYQLGRHAYGTSFEMVSWNAWCERRAAQAIPGVKTFIAGVRKLGGQVVFLSNRHVSTQQATIDNLTSEGLWSKGDVICLQTDDKAYDKATRRNELRSGEGACSAKGKPMTVLAYLGDTIHDFPEEGEETQEGGRDAQFGQRYFLFPNPMYGSWSRRVTRPLTP